MRVAHLVDSLTDIGGVQTYLTTLLPALRSRGVEGVLLAPGPAQEGRVLEEFAGAEVVAAASSGSDRGGHEVGAALRRALAHARAETLYVHFVPPAALAREVLAPYRPLVYAHDYALACPGHARYLHSRGSFCAEGPGLRCFWRAYSERCTNRRPDRLLSAVRSTSAWREELPHLGRLLVASPFVAGVMHSAGVPHSHVRVVPYPVAPFAPTEGSGDSIDVLFVGRLVASKGVHVLLRALAELPGVTAAVAGDGPARSGIESLAGELGLDDRLRMLGWVAPAQRARLLTSSRVFVMPSLWQEPFGIAGLEALAAGVPVVASEVGGIPSWLRDGDAGLLVPPADPTALAAALRSLLEDGALHARLVARAPEVAGAFSVDRHLDLLLPELEATAAS